jgi:hypothetical protein
MKPDYYYTKFGEVYSGFKWDNFDFPDTTILIQASKLQKYQNLNGNDQTLEKSEEYGRVLGNEVIEGVIKGEGFDPAREYYKSQSRDSSFERKYMFIFGAGASAHCVFGSDKNDFLVDPLRPPLGTSLFEKRFKPFYTKYSGVRESLHFLQDENPDIEGLFENEWKNISKHNNQAVLSRHINIQYYLQEILKSVGERVINEYYGKNLYAKLFNKLQKIYSASITKGYNNEISSKNFAFVTFNQDTILEYFACQQFGKKIDSIHDYVNINNSPFSIFKPHGSWNWGWKFLDSSQFGESTSESLFNSKANFFDIYFKYLGNHIDMVDWSSWGHNIQLNKNELGKFSINKSKIEIINTHNINAYFPALLLPYRDKDDFTMPISHFYEMESYLHYIETLVLIGWKGNEESFNHILLTRTNRLRKVIIVDPNHQTIKQNLAAILNNKSIELVVYKDFEDFVNTGVEKEII